MLDAQPPSRIVIAGGSGFLGVSLAAHLKTAGYEVVSLSRRNVNPPASHIPWDARTLAGWAAALDGAGAIINLVGRSVDCIKTPDHCDEIRRSRVEATRVLGEACRAVERPPVVWVQMSTAHIYGDPPVVQVDESSPTGYGLAPDVGRAWEAAFASAVLPAQRGVVLRTSFVIGKRNAGGAGALGKLGALSRLGLGGRVARGTHGMSWLHERDMNSIFERALRDATMHGVYNATAPSPVSQRDFARALRARAGGLGSIGFAPPAFAWMVRIGAPLLMRTDPELALYGRYVLPTRLLREGYQFAFSDVDAALKDVYAR